MMSERAPGKIEKGANPQGSTLGIEKKNGATLLALEDAPSSEENHLKLSRTSTGNGKRLDTFPKHCIRAHLEKGD